MLDETKLRQAFREALGLNSEALDYESLEFAKTQEWDSITHLRLIANIEELFGIRLNVKDVVNINSFKAAKEIVDKNLASIAG